MHRLSRVLSSLVLTMSTLHIAAQVNPYKDPTPGVSGFRAEVLAEVRVQEDKFMRLAEAIPADKYAWRPAPDVRSIAEVFLHVAAANYNLPKLIGTPPPSGMDIAKLEKSTTDKAKVTGVLKDSFAHERGGDHKNAGCGSGKEPRLVRRKNTERGILLFMVRHTAEHLGQAIAYARSVGVVPPWTEDQQRQQAPPSKGK